jgi:hypothetical protein
MSKSNPTTKEKLEKWLDDVTICHKRMQHGPLGIHDLAAPINFGIQLDIHSFIKVCKILNITPTLIVHVDCIDSDHYPYEFQLMYKSTKVFCVAVTSGYNYIMDRLEL